MTTITQALTAALGADRVADDAATRAAHAKDYWVVAHLRARQGRLGAGPTCVVKAQSTADVATAVRIAGEHGVPVVPYGGGSGVLGGAAAPEGSVAIDTTAMEQILELNETSLYVVTQAGLLGGEFERRLNAKGYMSGHYPQSIGVASVGGLVATRSAGQFSTRYGNIEDLLLGLEVVLPNGEIARVGFNPRAAAGPSLREIFCGSEGAFGIITEVTQRVFPMPERRALQSFAFPSVADGLDAMRRFMRVGWRPPVVRLYDWTESARNFTQWAPSNQAMLLLVSEGPNAMVDAEMAGVQAICEAGGGTVVGPEPVEQWLGHRNQVPSWDMFFDRGMVVDTIEIAATWDKVAALYDAAIAALTGAPGVMVASAHSSHSYSTGTNLYITFALRPDDFDAQAEELYLGAWGRVMEAALANGGTIAHHHGVGRLRTKWMERELGTGYPILQAVKKALDPKGGMNPGVLLR